MTPQELLTKTILAESSRDNSDFEDITHRATTKRAKVEYGDFRKIGKADLGDQLIQDEISFLNVIASYVAKGDKIVHLDKTYLVEYFSLVKEGVYNIFARKETRSGNLA